MTSFAWIYFALAFCAGCFVAYKITKWYYHAKMKSYMKEQYKLLLEKNQKIISLNDEIDTLTTKLATNDSTRRSSGL